MSRSIMKAQIEAEQHRAEEALERLERLEQYEAEQRWEAQLERMIEADESAAAQDADIDDDPFGPLV